MEKIERQLLNKGLPASRQGHPGAAIIPRPWRALDSGGTHRGPETGAANEPAPTAGAQHKRNQNGAINLRDLDHAPRPIRRDGRERWAENNEGLT